MSNASYLDTTILVDVSSTREPVCANALKHTKTFSPVYIADYAYKELLVGRVGLLCDAHNKIVASDNVIEVAMAFLTQASRARTPLAKATEILKPLKEMFEQKERINPAEAKREISEDLMLQAMKLWRKAEKFPGASLVQPLPCINKGAISLDSNGILRGPNGNFNCATKTTCGAAQYIYSNRESLKKMLESLEEERLPDALKSKGEIQSRRKALKLLLQRGPEAIDKRKCRQLGDAYFAAMCPPDAHILTTNKIDFVPLCEALGKRVETP